MLIFTAAWSPLNLYIKGEAKEAVSEALSSEDIVVAERNITYMLEDYSKISAEIPQVKITLPLNEKIMTVHTLFTPAQFPETIYLPNENSSKSLLFEARINLCNSTDRIIPLLRDIYEDTLLLVSKMGSENNHMAFSRQYDYLIWSTGVKTKIEEKTTGSDSFTIKTA